MPDNTSSPSQKRRIFISYRRIDSAGYAGRIYDRLVASFGKGAVFMDVDTIEGGTDFIKVLEDAVQSCDVLIALIGRQWLSIKDKNGKRRLDSPEDFVRIEIATALKRNIRVIPVLVDGVEMPHPTELSENLKALARRNALQVNHHSFNPDVYRLIEHTKSALDEAEELRVMKAQALQAAREKTAREKADREKAAKEAEEREEFETAVQEKARLEAEEQTRQEAAKEKAESELAEKIAREKAEKEAIEESRLKANELAKQKVERDATEQVAREKKEREIVEEPKPKAVKPKPIKEKLPRKTSQVVSNEPEIQSSQSNSGNEVAFWFIGFVVLVFIIGMLASNNRNTPSTSVPTSTRESSPTKTSEAVVAPIQSFTSTPAITPTNIVVSTLTGLPTEITDATGVSMMLVPEGEFTMGSNNVNDDAKPVHQVYLDAFYMDIYEVTNALYQACVDAGGCTPPQNQSSYTRSSYYGNSEFDNYPVIYVDWNQAKAYCEWRGPSTGLGQAQLPTEAQWEKAAARHGWAHLSVGRRY